MESVQLDKKTNGKIKQILTQEKDNIFKKTVKFPAISQSLSDKNISKTTIKEAFDLFYETFISAFLDHKVDIYKTINKDRRWPKLRNNFRLANAVFRLILQAKNNIKLIIIKNFQENPQKTIIINQRIDNVLNKALIEYHDYFYRILFEIHKSQLKEKTKEIEESKEEYLNLVENINDGIFTTDLLGKITFVNNKILEMFEKDKEELIGRNYKIFGKMMSPPFRGTGRRMRQIVRSKKTLEIETQFKRKDKKILSLRIELVPRTHKKKTTGIQGKITDITEKKKLEQRIQKTINYLQNIVNSVNDAIIVSDMKGNRYLLNENAKKTNEFIFNRKNLDQLGTVDIIAKTKDNNTKFLVASNAYLYDSKRKKTGTVSVVRDTTEKKLASMKLEESEKKYRDLVENINEGLVSIDSKARIIYLNHSFRNMIGIDETDLIGKRFTDIIHSSDRKTIMQYIDKRKKGTPSKLELRLIDKKGNIIYTIFSGVSIFKKEKYLGNYGVLTNITKIKLAEEKLRYHLLLEEAVAEASKEFVSPEGTNLNKVLRIIGKAVSVNRTKIFLFHKNYTEMKNINEWCARGTKPKMKYLQNLPTDKFPWMMKNIKNNENIVIQDIDKLPPEAHTLKEFSQEQDTRSLMIVPIYSKKMLLGFISLNDTEKTRIWQDYDKNILRVIGEMISNEFEHRKAERELRESEKRYRTLVKNAPLGIISIDKKGNIKQINSVFISTLRLPYKNKTNTIKDTVNAFTFKEFTESGITKNFRDCLNSGKNIISEQLYKTPQNRKIYLRYNLTPIRDEKNRITGAQAIIEDITERNKMEQALRESKEKIERFNEKLQEEIRTATIELEEKLTEISFMHKIGKTISSTLNLERILKKLITIITRTFHHKYCAIILKENNVLIPKVVEGMDTKKILENINDLNRDSNSLKAIRTGKSFIENNVDTSSHYIRINREIKSEIYIPIKIEKRSIGVIVIASERKNAFDNYDIELLNTISSTTSIAINNARLYNKLRESNIKLKELSNMKTDFISNISHELRTPLTSIMGYISLLNQGVLGELAKEQKDSIKIIEKEAESLANLINDLLDLSKIEANRIKLNISDIDINKIIENLNIYNLADEKRIKITRTLDRKLSDINADKEKIERIIINLISNAIKFTRPDGEITIMTQDMKDYIRIDVKDTGIGIPKEEIPKLFDKFHQIETQMTKKYKGTGLGLSIVKELVDMHKGIINVKSKENKGSVFSFSIPKKDISYPNRPCWEIMDCSNIECPRFHKKGGRCWSDQRDLVCRRGKDNIICCSACKVYNPLNK